MLVETTILLQKFVRTLCEADEWFKEVELALQGRTSCDMHGRVELEDEKVIITK